MEKALKRKIDQIDKMIWSAKNWEWLQKMSPEEFESWKQLMLQNLANQPGFPLVYKKFNNGGKND